jgi:epoxyqueuosine reductase
VKAEIRARALELGFEDCRVCRADPPDHANQLTSWLEQGRHGEMAWLARNAAKRTDPQQVLPGAKSVIVVALNYGAATTQPSAFSLQPSHGVVARYARYTDYHDVMGEKLRTLTRFLDEQGGPGTRSLWYVDTGPVLERDFAQRAGVGFIGKHTNVISRRLGNWFLLAEILTTAEFEPDPPERNHCGSCARCLAACPTQAIVAPFELDARRCLSYLTIEFKGSIPLEFRPALGRRIFGCDDCLAVCPWNRFARAGRWMAEHFRGDLEAPDLVELLALDEAGFRRRFAGTPLLRPKRRGLLRNVCVALGNVGDASALPALKRAASDAEPLIAEHARWAIKQIEARGSATAPRQITD